MDTIKSYWPFKMPAKKILDDDVAHDYVKVCDVSCSCRGDCRDDIRRLTHPVVNLQLSRHNMMYDSSIDPIHCSCRCTRTSRASNSTCSSRTSRCCSSRPCAARAWPCRISTSPCGFVLPRFNNCPQDAYRGAKSAARQTSATFDRVYTYLQNDGSVLAKAGAITVGGMAGFLWGMRTGGPVKRVLGTAAGLATMTAFCYPHETVRTVRHTFTTGADHWAMHGPGKPDEHEEKVTTEPAAQKSSKDIQLYTTRSEKID